MTTASLGIDIGTGSSKACLLDIDGRVLSVARASHNVLQPRSGWSEIDPRSWLQSIAAAVKEARLRAPEATIATVGLTGQMHGIVVCTEDGEPTRPAVLWPDTRADAYLAEAAERLGSDVATLGNPLYPGLSGPILLALAHEDPGALRSARWVLQPKDWIRLLLTGNPGTDPSDASGTLLWDIERSEWSPRAADAFRVPLHQLPPVLASCSIAGHSRAGPADAMGIPPGLPIATGAADTAAALFGAGVDLGETQVTTGTGGQIAILSDEPRVDPHGQTNLFRGVGHDRWYALAAIQNVGLAMDWALRTLGADFAEAERATATTEPGSGGVVFVPYLTGERCPRMDAGLTGQWVGLRLGTSRNEVLRSVFEGVAYAMRDGLDALRAAGHHIDEALLAGGGSTAGWWRQLLADALGIPLVPHSATDASARGAAMIGFQAIGVHVDPKRQVQRATPVYPQTATAPSAAEAYRTAASAR
jgi:xylulokinase